MFLQNGTTAFGLPTRPNAPWIIGLGAKRPGVRGTLTPLRKLLTSHCSNGKCLPSPTLPRAPDESRVPGCPDETGAGRWRGPMRVSGPGLPCSFVWGRCPIAANTAASLSVSWGHLCMLQVARRPAGQLRSSGHLRPVPLAQQVASGAPELLATFAQAGQLGAPLQGAPCSVRCHPGRYRSRHYGQGPSGRSYPKLTQSRGTSTAFSSSMTSAIFAGKILQA